MKLSFAIVIAAGIAGFPVAALAEIDGSRQPAGGAFMSSATVAASEGELIFAQPTRPEQTILNTRRPQIQPVWTGGRP